MKNKSVHILIISLIVLVATMVSCYEDDTCNQNTDTGVNISVSSSGNDANTDQDSIDYSEEVYWTITKIDDTTSLINSNNISYSPGIPLDINSDSIKFLFNIRNTSDSIYIVDTVTFYYIQTDLEALSINCGFAPVFEMTGGHHSLRVLDSVVRREDIISTDLTLENVSFYY